MGDPVVHFEITGVDADALHRFYGDLFGWKVQSVPEMGYGIVDTDSDGRGIAGGIGQAADGPGHVTFYVEVDDLEAYLERAMELGGRTVMAPFVVPGQVAFALLADPEGHVVGIVRSQPPAG